MDISKFLGNLGIDPGEMQQLLQNPDLDGMIDDPEIRAALESDVGQDLLGKVSGIFAQGGITPGDMEDLMQSVGGAEGVLAGMQQMFGTGEYDEIDLDEEVAAYQPAAEDAADRKFCAALKAWLTESLAAVPVRDISALSVSYEATFTSEEPVQTVYTVWFGYNTAENDEKARARQLDPWNIVGWTNEVFLSLPDEPFAAWREAQGYDEENDGEEMEERLYDLIAVAVMELHKEHCTEQLFGRKLPFLIGGMEFWQKTAIRAVKVNGAELFDKIFFADCGFTNDDA